MTIRWQELVCKYLGHTWVNIYMYGAPIDEALTIGIRTWEIKNKGYKCKRCHVTRGDASSESLRDFFVKALEAEKNFRNSQ